MLLEEMGVEGLQTLDQLSGMQLLMSLQTW